MKNRKIKQRCSRAAAVAWIAVLAAGTFASCTRGDAEPDPQSGSLQIALNAAVAPSAPQTKAPESGSNALTLYIARADETSAGVSGSYTTTAISATRTAGTGAQPLTFSPVQYYRADGLKTRLTGWYPGGATATGDATGKGYYDGTASTVSWTIDGQQDVMTAPRQQGSYTAALPAMTFNHVLTQLQFYPYAENQTTIDNWGKITQIEVLNQQNTVVYTLSNGDDATGAVSFGGGTDHSFSAGIAAGGAALSLSTVAAKVTNVRQMGNPVMIAPQSAADNVLTLRITTAKNRVVLQTLTQPLTAGVPYRLYLRFKEFEITIDTAVTEWDTKSTSDKIGEVRIGDIRDGGVVYWIDPTNQKNYKLVALDGTDTEWGSTLVIYNIIGPGTQNTTDGRINVAAMKAYSLNNMNNPDLNKRTTGDFDYDFGPAPYCDQMGNGWYFPAIDELKELYDAYQAHKAVIDDAISSNNGVEFYPYSYWSSTESSIINGTNTEAWLVDFADGSKSTGGKGWSCQFRCIRR